jgi:hypothetical protein
MLQRNSHVGPLGRPARPWPSPLQSLPFISMSDDPVSISGASPPPPYLVLKILSARYGPCENQHQQHRRQERTNTRETDDDEASSRHENVPSAAAASSAAHKKDDEGCSNSRNDDNETMKHEDLRARRWTRDVARQVVHCVRNGSMKFDGGDGAPVDGCTTEESKTSWTCTVNDDENQSRGVVRIRPVNRDGMMVTLVPVELPTVGGMNVVFGDPCPGTTKRLYVEYTIEESTRVSNKGGGELPSAPVVHRMSFAEQEPVVLRRHSHSEHSTQRANGESGSEQKAAATVSTNRQTSNNDKDAAIAEAALADAATLSELILPLTLPWLTLPERVACHQVCGGWRSIVQTWGLATTIDVNQLGGGTARGLTVPVLRGLLLHSFASLQSLYVSGMAELQKCDLHPALASMKRLRAVDISYCTYLDDETLHALSSSSGLVHETLQVLYIKGLRKVTDAGLVALASCHNVRVLDVSRIPFMTDASGTCLGRSLVELRAFYCRDNYQITQTSVGALVENCLHLEQLTLWGCTRLKQLHPFPSVTTGGMGTAHPLVLLNLWGCHSLQDDAAQALVNMRHLKTLIVSECHKLTDRFLVRGHVCRISFAHCHPPRAHRLHLTDSSQFASRRPSCNI